MSARVTPLESWAIVGRIGVHPEPYVYPLDGVAGVYVGDQYAGKGTVVAIVLARYDWQARYLGMKVWQVVS